MNRTQLCFFTAATIVGLSVAPVFADANGTQPETPAGMNQAPVAGSPKVPKNGVPSLEVEFQSGRSDIPPTFSRNIDAFGKYLKENPASRATIIAYADHTGQSPANQALAQKRADTVAAYLASNYGVQANRIDAKGYGEVSDKLRNETGAARQADRRAFGKIIPSNG